MKRAYAVSTIAGRRDGRGGIDITHHLFLVQAVDSTDAEQQGMKDIRRRKPPEEGWEGYDVLVISIFTSDTAEMLSMLLPGPQEAA